MAMFEPDDNVSIKFSDESNINSDDDVISNSISEVSDSNEIAKKKQRITIDNYKEKKSRSKLKHKKKTGSKYITGVNAFLDVEALVGEDEDEEEYDYDDDIYHDESELALSTAELDSRRLADQDLGNGRLRRHLGGAGHLEHTIAQLERRYEQMETETAGDVIHDNYEQVEDIINIDEPTNILPSIKDPKLWLVKVDKVGTEREICIALVQKAAESYMNNKKLPILSAYAASNFRGCLYIEAEAPSDVRDALEGLSGVRLSSIKLIPVKEMTQVFSVDMQEKELLTRDSWVRIRSGLYAGDLAQIYEVDEHESNVIVRLVPRLDIPALIRKSQGIIDKNFGNKRIRPQAKLFDRDKVENLGGIVELTHLRGTAKFANQLFELDKGYLLKKMRSNRLITGTLVNPSIEEIQTFYEGIDISDIPIHTQAILSSKKSANFFVGDMITILRGELTNTKARITSINNLNKGILEVLPIDKSLGITKPILIQQDLVSKYFEIGDSVLIIEGTHESESGLVTGLEMNNTIAVIYPLSGTIPIRCPTNFLKRVSQNIVASSSLSTIDGFSLDDLVQLSDGTIGVITFVGRNRNLKVLNSNGEISTVKSSEISSKRHTSLVTRVTDHNGTIFGAKSMVSILDGPDEGKSGRVEHIWKSICFVKIPIKLDDGGYIVCDSRSLAVIRSNDDNLNNSNTHTKPKKVQSSGHGGFGRIRGMGLISNSRKQGPDDMFVNQKVRILRGRHKALLGSIRGFKGNNIEILLDIGPHTVVLRREDVVMIGTPMNNGSNIAPFSGITTSKSFENKVSTHNWSGESNLLDINKESLQEVPIFCKRGVEVTVISQGEFFKCKGVVSAVLLPPEVPQITCHVVLIVNGQISPDDIIAIAPQSLIPNPPSIGQIAVAITNDREMFVGNVDKIEGNTVYMVSINNKSINNFPIQSVFQYHIPPS
ncbi:KOW motif family protein [Cryptosporidium andersoni]|uniref:KOW motif family protein n=1 Tax=Cryptosporidium andersoni TaxID=117008 RepID=A0A1J4M9W1_9CRYT|nr:KOW motif family protein [Cryptosporidium andersoni]